MEIGTNPDYDNAFAAALDWWRQAGVDNVFHDEPRSWLPHSVEQSAPTATPSRPGTSANDSERLPTREQTPAPPALPDNLEAFRSWWLSHPGLDGGRVSGRVPPRGEVTSELMIIAPMPESTDREHLLGGAEGKLIDLFLAQAGVGADAVYRASALPCHSPATDWTVGSNQDLAAALQHHVLLARPKRLLVIGFNILPLLSHASAQGPAVSSSFNHEGGTVPMLAVRRIPAVASQPRWKCILWQAWLDWTA
jgi:DNA polymerase